MAPSIALVTGAGSGIGRASAMALAAAGWHVVLAGRRLEALEETAARLDGAHTVTQVDVTDPGSVGDLFARLVRELGRLDLLFNNAGMDVPGVPVAELTFDDWSRVLATNLTGAFLCAQGAFRMMMAQEPKGGRIINNGSVTALSPRPNSVPYSASKHGITGLTKALMIDGRPHRIAVCQIDIGNAAADPGAPRAPALQADGRRLVEPVMSMSRVAETIAYVASLPLDENIPFLTVMATNMPLVGRG